MCWREYPSVASPVGRRLKPFMLLAGQAIADYEHHKPKSTKGAS